MALFPFKPRAMGAAECFHANRPASPYKGFTPTKRIHQGVCMERGGDGMKNRLVYIVVLLVVSMLLSSCEKIEDSISTTETSSENFNNYIPTASSGQNVNDDITTTERGALGLSRIL